MPLGFPKQTVTADEPSSDGLNSTTSSSEESRCLTTDTVAPVAISDTQEAQQEEAPLGEDKEAATEGPCSTEQSQSSKTEPATDGAGADSTLEETAVTHVRSSSDGGFGTENRQALLLPRLSQSTPEHASTTRKWTIR